MRLHQPIPHHLQPHLGIPARRYAQGGPGLANPTAGQSGTAQQSGAYGSSADNAANAAGANNMGSWGIKGAAIGGGQTIGGAGQAAGGATSQAPDGGTSGAGGATTFQSTSSAAPPAPPPPVPQPGQITGGVTEGTGDGISGGAQYGAWGSGPIYGLGSGGNYTGGGSGGGVMAFRRGGLIPRQRYDDGGDVGDSGTGSDASNIQDDTTGVGAVQAISSAFPNSNWDKFESEARPSENVEYQSNSPLARFNTLSQNMYRAGGMVRPGYAGGGNVQAGSYDVGAGAGTIDWGQIAQNANNSYYQQMASYAPEAFANPTTPQQEGVSDAEEGGADTAVPDVGTTTNSTNTSTDPYDQAYDAGGLVRKRRKRLGKGLKAKKPKAGGVKIPKPQAPPASALNSSQQQDDSGSAPAGGADTGTDMGQQAATAGPIPSAPQAIQPPDYEPADTSDDDGG